MSLYELFSNFGNLYFSFKLINNFQKNEANKEILFKIRKQFRQPENLYEISLMYVIAQMYQYNMH